MNKHGISRIVSVLVGAGVLFGLEEGLGVKLYIAKPVAIVVYLAVKVTIGLLWGADERATCRPADPAAFTTNAGASPNTAGNRDRRNNRPAAALRSKPARPDPHSPRAAGKPAVVPQRAERGRSYRARSGSRSRSFPAR